MISVLWDMLRERQSQNQTIIISPSKMQIVPTKLAIKLSCTVKPRLFCSRKQQPTIIAITPKVVAQHNNIICLTEIGTITFFTEKIIYIFSSLENSLIHIVLQKKTSLSGQARKFLPGEI